MEAKDSKVQATPETFKVLITGCANSAYWYKDNVGEAIEVIDYNEREFHKTNSSKLILKSDCHVIEPTWKVMKDAEETGRSVEYWDDEWKQDTRQTAPWYPNCIYRLTPESKQPEYEPYSYEDRDVLRGLWVRRKGNNEEELMITAIGLYRIGTSERLCPSYRELFDNYETLDGQPVGKLK